jgi:hypothetical protein
MLTQEQRDSAKGLYRPTIRYRPVSPSPCHVCEIHKNDVDQAAKESIRRLTYVITQLKDAYDEKYDPGNDEVDTRDYYHDNLDEMRCEYETVAQHHTIKKKLLIRHNCRRKHDRLPALSDSPCSSIHSDAV